MLENPTVYVNVDDNIDDLPSNVNVVYVTQGADVDEDGNIVFVTSASEKPGESDAEVWTEEVFGQDTKLLPPSIIASSIVSTPRELADGSIVSDVSFSVDEVPGAAYYEVRYTQ